MPRESLGRRRADDAELHAFQRAQVLRTREQPIDEGVDGVRAREHDPVELAGVRAGLVERAVVVGRHDADHRRFDRVGAHRLEPVDEFGGLLARPRDQDALAEERPRVEPPQVLAQRRDASDDEDRGAAIGRLFDLAATISSSVPTIVSCVGSVPS